MHSILFRPVVGQRVGRTGLSVRKRPDVCAEASYGCWVISTLPSRDIQVVDGLSSVITTYSILLNPVPFSANRERKRERERERVREWVSERGRERRELRKRCSWRHWCWIFTESILSRYLGLSIWWSAPDYIRHPRARRTNEFHHVINVVDHVVNSSM